MHSVCHIHFIRAVLCQSTAMTKTMRTDFPTILEEICVMPCMILFAAFHNQSTVSAQSGHINCYRTMEISWILQWEAICWEFYSWFLEPHAKRIRVWHQNSNSGESGIMDGKIKFLECGNTVATRHRQEIGKHPNQLHLWRGDHEGNESWHDG